MPERLFFLAQLLFFSLNLWAFERIIERVELRGNHSLKNIPLLSQKGLPMEDSILEEDKRNIRRLYSELGFLNTEVTVHRIFKKRGVILIFQIKEGERVKFKWSGRILPTGNRKTTLPIKIKEVVRSEEEIELNIKRLLQYYADFGRPFAKISPKNFTLNRNTIIYDLEIEEGDSVWIEDVSFTGSVTREPTLKRILNLPRGFLFSEKKLTSKIRRLTSDRENPTEFKGLEILAKDGRYDLKIHLKERRQKHLGFLFTYLPKEREFAGFLSLTLPNLFYTRRNLKLRWEGRRRDAEYFLSYAEPFLFWTERGEVSFRHKNYDTLQAKTNITAGCEIRTGQEFLSLFFLVGYEMVREYKREDVRFSYLGQELKWDSREGLLPKKGLYLSLLSYAGNRRAPKGSRPARGLKSGLRLKGEVLFDFLGVVPSLYLFGERIFADTLLEREKTYLGGRERLRGFREEELPSSSVFLFRPELKFPIGESFFFLFFDVGGRKKSGYEFRTSYGFGLEMLQGASCFGLVYAVPDFGNVLSGKVHLMMNLGF